MKIMDLFMHGTRFTATLLEYTEGAYPKEMQPSPAVQEPRVALVPGNR